MRESVKPVTRQVIFPRRELAEISFQPRYTSDVVFMIEKPFRWGARTYLKPNHVNDKRRYYREEYLKSEHWAGLKASKLRRHPFCQSCGGESCLDVHHIRYKDLYNVELSDLLTLCRSCHETLHKWMRESKYETWDWNTKQTGLPEFMRGNIPSYEI